MICEDDIQRNILYEPLSPAVKRQVHKANIHVSEPATSENQHAQVLPDELTEADVGYIVRNKVYNQQPKRRYYFQSPNTIHVSGPLSDH
jgi:hypothetical protein